jgi:hypothetical protein
VIGIITCETGYVNAATTSYRLERPVAVHSAPPTAAGKIEDTRRVLRANARKREQQEDAYIIAVPSQSKTDSTFAFPHLLFVTANSCALIITQDFLAANRHGIGTRPRSSAVTSSRDLLERVTSRRGVSPLVVNKNERRF